MGAWLRKIRWTIFVYAALSMMLLAEIAHSVEYTFEKIVDSSGIYKSFTTNTAGPSINDHGDVVFHVELDNGNRRLVVWSGGVEQTIATSNGLSPYRDLLFAFGPAMNNNRDVVFHAVGFLQGAGVFTGPDSNTDVIADERGPYNGFGLYPAIDESGGVVFQSTLAGAVSGLYRGPDPVADKIIDSTGPFASFSQFAVNSAGELVFVATLDTGVSGVFTGTDPVADRVADSSGAFKRFQSPRLNDNGEVVFQAELDSGVTGVYNGPDPVLNKLVDTTDGFELVAGGLLNNQAQFAFGALFNGGKVGIFTGKDPVADRVIAVGDMLFGSSTTALSGFKLLNNVGQMVLGYALATGEQGIVIVSPGLPGDYNQDGVVDAADYVVWRKNDGTPDGYNTWRTNFGRTAGSDSDVIVNTAIPEPATTAILIMAVAGWCLRRARAL